jgi:hypothetical protein
MRPNGAYYRFTGRPGRVQRCKPEEARAGVTIQVGCKVRVLESCKSVSSMRTGTLAIVGFEEFEDSTVDPRPDAIIELGIDFGDNAVWYHAHELETKPHGAS